MDAASSLVDKAAEKAAKDAQIAAAKVDGSMLKKIAVAESGAKKAVRLGLLRGALGALGKVTGVLGAAATGFSAGARAAFIGDCLKECPCP